jgi:hypothetical protein
MEVSDLASIAIVALHLQEGTWDAGYLPVSSEQSHTYANGLMVEGAADAGVGVIGDSPTNPGP